MHPWPKAVKQQKKCWVRDIRQHFCRDRKLIFYPMDVENKEAWSIELTEEEARAAQETGEYSILEFQDHAAYVYYDACAVDNALFITNRCNSNCIMCPVSSIVRKKSGIARIEELLQIVKQIPSDAEHLTITGGEPFLLKKDLFRLFFDSRRSSCPIRSICF